MRDLSSQDYLMQSTFFMIEIAKAFQTLLTGDNIAGFQLTSRRPCWWTKTKSFSPLGTKLVFCANSAKENFIVLSTSMAPALSLC